MDALRQGRHALPRLREWVCLDAGSASTQAHPAAYEAWQRGQFWDTTGPAKKACIVRAPSRQGVVGRNQALRIRCEWAIEPRKSSTKKDLGRNVGKMSAPGLGWPACTFEPFRSEVCAYKALILEALHISAHPISSPYLDPIGSSPLWREVGSLSIALNIQSPWSLSSVWLAQSPSLCFLSYKKFCSASFHNKDQKVSVLVAYLPEALAENTTKGEMLQDNNHPAYTALFFRNLFWPETECHPLRYLRGPVIHWGKNSSEGTAKWIVFVPFVAARMAELQPFAIHLCSQQMFTSTECKIPEQFSPTAGCATSERMGFSRTCKESCGNTAQE
ncbi:hypothetical protein B0H13DRAFT_1869024 [Mycena leptocephala]|nr:hypothetical protein B0H13DRAFT_1869024 [Mycena leptocephala]